VVSAGQLRACVAWLTETYKVSQRRACRLLGRARSAVRYRRRARPDEAPLVRAIRRLARRHPRWGYRRAHALLVADGWRVNRKRVRRLWAALGLARPARRKKPRKLGPKRGSSANSCASSPARFKNDVWTCDFIADRTSDGRKLKWLSVVDEYTRECLLLYPQRSLGGADVRRELARVAGRRGAPRRLRCDNGGEFLCDALGAWLPRQGGEVTPVAPARPWENGFVESFHSRLRDEFLECREFESLADAREQAAWFRREYNTVRPHSALGYKAPRQFSDECDQGRHGQPTGQKKARQKKLCPIPNRGY
jgi:putative transposase